MKRLSTLLPIAGVAALAVAGNSVAQSGSPTAEELELLIDPIFSHIMADQNIPGAVFVMVKDGRILLKKGYGHSDLAGDRRVDPDLTIFRIGSITKTFTATAVMQLVDRGLIDLEADVNRYLSHVQVPPTFSEPVTVADLLRHTSGFDEIGPGRQAFSEAELQSLSEFLRDRLIRVRPPGDVPAYSTYGIALAGLLVEEITRQPLDAYLQDNLWQPLGMDRTSIRIPTALEQDVAVGYEYEGERNRAQPWEWYQTYPASDINSTAADMAKYMIAHLRDGAYRDVRMLSDASAREMKTLQATGHPRVSGFGYGFYENLWAGQRTIDHGGDMLGFSAYLLMIPEHDAGVFIAHHHEGERLRYDVVSAIMERFYRRAPGFEIPEPSGASKTNGEFAGTYRWLSSCKTCSGGDPGVTWNITANEDGSLSMIGRRFIQVEPLFFASEDGNLRLGFRRDEAGGISHLFLGNQDSFEKIEG
ncbi:MAG: serine hydrolase domain-containing protein [Gemmatimonadota bacterium]